MNDGQKEVRTDPTQSPFLQSNPFQREEEEEDFSHRYDTRKILLGIQRHLGTIATCIVLCTVLGIIAMWYYTHHYQAEAVVIFQEDLPKELPGGITMNNLSLATSMDLITLPTNFQAVKAVLGLTLPTKDLEEMVFVPQPHYDSHLIRILTKADNPNLAMDISNALAKIAVKNSQDFNQRQLQAELENFRGQLAQTTLQLTAEQKEIQDFKTNHQYFEMTADYTTLLTQLVETRNELQNANLRYNSLQVEYENLKNEEKNMGLGFDSRDTYFDPLQTRINTLETNLAEAKARYAPANPKVKILEDELGNLLEKAKKSGEEGERISPELVRMQGKVRSAQKMKQDLSQAVESLEKQMETLPAEQLAFAKLLHASKMTQEEAQFLAKSADSIQLMLNVPKGSLDLYHLADKAKPLKDSWIVKILPLIGLIGGFFLGILVAAFKEMSDSKLRTPKQIEISYDIPFYTQIPNIEGLNKDNCTEKLLYFTRTLAERIDRKISSLTPLNIGRVITITSSTAGEGKSCLAHLIAQYYQIIGNKVLLLEMDARENSFSEPSPATPLEAFLETDRWHDYIIKNFPDHIKAWGDDPYMKEVVKSRAMGRFINHLKNEYDLVIIDAPGIIEEHYAANLAALGDLCIFIIGSDSTDKDIVDESLRELSYVGVKPCGLILNKVLPVYINDTKIKQEITRPTVSFWKKLFFWLKHEE